MKRNGDPPLERNRARRSDQRILRVSEVGSIRSASRHDASSVGDSIEEKCDEAADGDPSTRPFALGFASIIEREIRRVSLVPSPSGTCLSV